MKIQAYLVIVFISYSLSIKPKENLNKTVAEVKKNLEKYEKSLSQTQKHKIVSIQITNVTQAKLVPPAAPKIITSTPKMIPPIL